LKRNPGKMAVTLFFLVTIILTLYTIYLPVGVGRQQPQAETTKFQPPPSKTTETTEAKTTETRERLSTSTIFVNGSQACPSDSGPGVICRTATTTFVSGSTPCPVGVPAGVVCSTVSTTSVFGSIPCPPTRAGFVCVTAANSTTTSSSSSSNEVVIVPVLSTTVVTLIVVVVIVVVVVVAAFVFLRFRSRKPLNPQPEPPYATHPSGEIEF
jgi:ABC-type glycerol-3-phosphate transport system permease component